MQTTGQFEWLLLATPLKFKELASDPANATVPSNTVSLYAKDKAGTSDLYFKDDGGTVHDLGLLPPSAQALTRVNDTNVTLTLGGTPASALLAATSLTLGWTGQLAASRGGTGVSSLGDITKVDDTNVTLTLGGTPTGAVITSTSFTLGWTGTLGVSRGGTGTGTAFTQGSVVFAGASGVYSQDNSNFFWDATNHRLGIGNAAPVTTLHVQQAATTAPRNLTVDNFGNIVGGTTVTLRKTRGASVGAFSQVLSGDVIASFAQAASDGSAFLAGAGFLRTAATENQTSTTQGFKVQFVTIPNGSASASVQWEVGQDASLTAVNTGAFIDLTAITGVVAKVPVDNTDPTGGGGAATGRIPVSVGGVTHYLAYY